MTHLTPYSALCVSCGDLVQGVLRPGERLDGPRVRCGLCNPAAFDDFVVEVEVCGCCLAFVNERGLECDVCEANPGPPRDVRRPRLLDAFSGAGGCAVGYHRAGFDVVGVDIKPQPRYPYAFHQGDALEFIREHGHEFDVIHASPPCQNYSRTRSLHSNVHPDLVDATRVALMASGKPWVIENVEEAPLTGIVLCGLMFDGLKVYRHRRFESSVRLTQPEHPKHVSPVLSGRYQADWDGFVTVTGGGNVPLRTNQEAMDISWMTMRELSQAIPPAYTHHIGLQLITHLRNDIPWQPMEPDEARALRARIGRAA